MNLFKSVAIIFATLGCLAATANACPNGLRPFNKKLENKDACIIEGRYTGKLELSSGYNYVMLGAVWIGKEIRTKTPNGDYVLAEPIVPGHLIVQPGVRIFALNPIHDKTGFWSGVVDKNGAAVQGDIKTFVSVSRDSKIEIMGQENAPVVMTSGQGAHQTQPTAKKAPMDWGGLVINGKAKTNKCVNFAGCTVPGEAGTGYYGGDNDNHSSGRINYLQIEFGGDRVDAKKELNGVTFNAVGLGTELSNIAVLFNSDDCIEFFGGAATARNIFCYKGDDDGIDTTDGARIFLQNGIVVLGDFLNAGKNDRHAVEADSSKNDAANARLTSHPVLANFTFVGGKNTQGFKLRRGTDYTIVNSVMVGVDLWCLDPEGSRDVNLFSNVFSGCNNTDPIMTFQKNEFPADAKNLKMNGYQPTAGSPLMAGAHIMEEFSTDEDLDEAFADFYEEVEYRGAMGSKDWTKWIVIAQ